LTAKVIEQPGGEFCPFYLLLYLCDFGHKRTRMDGGPLMWHYFQRGR
jgi:hypothetical protein